MNLLRVAEALDKIADPSLPADRKPKETPPASVASVWHFLLSEAELGNIAPNPLELLDRVLVEQIRIIKAKLEDKRASREAKELAGLILKELKRFRDEVSGIALRDIEDAIHYSKEAYHKLIRKLADLNCSVVCGNRGGRGCAVDCMKLHMDVVSVMHRSHHLLDTCYDKEKAARLKGKLEQLLKRSDIEKSKLAAILAMVFFARAYGYLEKDSSWLWELTRSRLELPHYIWRGDVAALVYLLAGLAPELGVDIGRTYSLTTSCIVDYVRVLLK